MQKPERRIVQPNSLEGWDVIKPDATRASAHTSTKAAALKRARQILGNVGGGDLEIRDHKGRVQKRESVPPGSDTKATAKKGATKSKHSILNSLATNKQTPITVKKTPGFKARAAKAGRSNKSRAGAAKVMRKKPLP